MTRNLRMTGAVAASDAARVLGDPNATGAERSAAASALAQAAYQARQTRAQAASDAARVLRDPAATSAERSAVGSVLGAGAVARERQEEVIEAALSLHSGRLIGETSAGLGAPAWQEASMLC
jgi:hypothetical protein